MVKTYDANTPTSLSFYCEFMGISVDEFYQVVEPMRDSSIWHNVGGVWTAKDAIYLHQAGEKEDAARVDQVADRTFSEANRNLYFNPDHPPKKTGEQALDQRSEVFIAH